MITSIPKSYLTGASMVYYQAVKLECGISCNCCSRRKVGPQNCWFDLGFVVKSKIHSLACYGLLRDNFCRFKANASGSQSFSLRVYECKDVCGLSMIGMIGGSLKTGPLKMSASVVENPLQIYATVGKSNRSEFLLLWNG